MSRLCRATRVRSPGERPSHWVAGGRTPEHYVECVTVWRARQERKLPLRAGSCREPDIAGQPSESDHSPLNTSLPTKWARGASPTRGETGQASLRLSRRAVTRRSPGWSRRPGRASTAAHASLAYPRPPASGGTRTRSPPRRAPSCETTAPGPQGVDRSPGRTVLIIDPGCDPLLPGHPAPRRPRPDHRRPAARSGPRRRARELRKWNLNLEPSFLAGWSARR